MCLLIGELAQNAHRIFALDLVTRMHHPIGQLAVGGKNKQAGSIDIEAANGDPLAVFNARQIVEYRDAIPRVTGGHDLALGLVVQQNARQLFVEFQFDRALINHHVVAR